MPFMTDPLYVSTVLLLLVALSEWLCRHKFFRAFGSALIVILAAAVLANLRLLPSSSNAPPLYDGIFNYLAPLAIFFLLLDVRLKDLRKAGLPMLILFSCGAASTVIGTLVGYRLVAPQLHGVENAFAVGGMFTGTYIGGSVNLNAVALQYGVTKNGTLFAAINAADNIITTTWIVATILLPRFLQKWFPRGASAQKSTTAAVATAETLEAREQISVLDLTLLLALGLGTLLASQLVSRFLPVLPVILVLTTLALVLAQLPLVQKLRGAHTLGYFCVLLFLAVIGAYCDIPALIANGSVAGILLLWGTIIVGLHGVLLFVGAGLLRQDWAMISVASNANIGGATSAGVLATAIGRDDLRLPGILVGSVGNALGTYAGILVAEILRR
ncbi:MAG: DUF819 domain-containing protein [Chthoniobacterales bacterium]